MKQYLIRNWICTSCDRPNATEVALDGSAVCDHCVVVTKIQASGARGRESPSQLAAFILADSRRRQGEWTEEP